MEAATWLLTVLSVLGVVLNIRKNRASFTIWMLTNASWAVIDIRAGIPAQAVLFGIYFALSAYGYWAWGRLENISRTKPETRSYEQGGSTRYVTEIVADQIQFLGGGDPKPAGSQNTGGGNVTPFPGKTQDAWDGSKVPEDDDSSIPF